MQTLRTPSPSRPIAEDQLRKARTQMRAQISSLERELSKAELDCARPLIHRRESRAEQPRIASLGELEQRRDELIDTLRHANAIAERIEEKHSAARRMLQEILADPKSHKFARIRNADMGLPSCKTYEVRPRLGLVGMLAGWWQVKISSGCP